MYQFAVITTFSCPRAGDGCTEARALNKDTTLIVLFTIFLALGIGILIRISGLLSFDFLFPFSRILRVFSYCQSTAKYRINSIAIIRNR